MRICYIASANIPSRSANSIHVMKMSEAYAALGHDVTLMVPRWKNSESGVDNVYAFYGVEKTFRMRHVRAPYWPRYSLPYFSIWLPSLALRTHPDLIHTRSVASAWGLTNLLRSRVLFETHKPWSEPGRQRDMFVQVVRSRRLEGLVVITQALERFMHERPRCAPVIVAPDGVDSATVDFTLEKQTARDRIGLPELTQSVAVYTGHLFAGRGIELIIELARKTPAYHFLVVGGKQEDVAHYRSVADDVSNMRFVGFVPPRDVRVYLQAADVLLMPYADRVMTTGGIESGRYASPMKMFEYMAAGRPIVASTLPVLQEVLRDGENAKLISYDRPDQWHQSLMELRYSPSYADALGAQSREDVRKYTWARRAAGILEQIQTGLGKST